MSSQQPPVTLPTDQVQQMSDLMKRGSILRTAEARTTLEMAKKVLRTRKMTLPELHQDPVLWSVYMRGREDREAELNQRLQTSSSNANRPLTVKSESRWTSASSTSTLASRPTSISSQATSNRPITSTPQLQQQNRKTHTHVPLVVGAKTPSWDRAVDQSQPQPETAARWKHVSYQRRDEQRIEKFIAGLMK